MWLWLSRFRWFDWWIMGASALLMVLGLSMIYVIELSGGSLNLFYRQLAYLAIGLVALVVVSRVDYHRMSQSHRYLYIGLLLALAYLEIFGAVVRGTVGWIELGIINVQPAEIAKLILILGLSRILYLERGAINSWSVMLKTSLYAGLPALLIVLQPDLGSALVVGGVWFGLLVISHLRFRFIALFLVIMVVVSGLTWQFGLRDYQRNRVQVFLNPNLDPQGRGYNVRQALVAVGGGGVLGQGLGRGMQSQLRFLPERHTDFIFASAAEDIGLVGTLGVLACYGIILGRLIYQMRRAKDALGYYILGGVWWYFSIQILINIGMNIGIMPVTGITLPLVSYGGSALITTLISLGVVQNIIRQSRSV